MGAYKLSNNKKTVNRKGRGFTPVQDRNRTEKTVSPKKNPVLIYVAIIVIVAGAGIGYWYLNRGTSGEVTTPSGLKYADQVVGTGKSPSPGDRVKVHYTGTLKDGTKFDSSVDRNQPFEFVIGVGQVIKGWDEGLSTMKIGGKRRLIIPPNLGYGASGTPRIPANSTLFFDVELLGIN
jgi:hypothetical protein